MERTIPVILQWDESFDIGSDTITGIDDTDYLPPFPLTEVARPNGARKIVSFLEVSGVKQKDQRRETEKKESQQRVQSADSP